MSESAPTKNKPLTPLQTMLGGIIFLASGLAILAGWVLTPDFFLSFVSEGIWGILAPFFLIPAGIILILAPRDDKIKAERA